MSKKNTTTPPPDVVTESPKMHLNREIAFKIIYEKFSKLLKTPKGLENLIMFNATGYTWTNNNAALCVYDVCDEFQRNVGKSFTKYGLESNIYLDVLKTVKTYPQIEELSNYIFNTEVKQAYRPISFFGKIPYVRIGNSYYHEPTISTLLQFNKEAGVGVTTIDFYSSKMADLEALYAIITVDEGKQKLAEFVMMPDNVITNKVNTK